MSNLILLRGGSVLTGRELQIADVLLDGEAVAQVQPNIEAPDTARAFDIGGLILAPGFIDVHVHGGGGHSLLTSNIAEVEEYSRWAPSRGVTSFLATICAPDLESGLQYANAAASARCEGADVLGINFEGPFVSPQRRGALPEDWLCDADLSLLDRLLASSPVRLMTVAPELDGAFGVIEAALKAGVRVSIGHTDCTYEIAKRAFASGASHVTHAFNAMRPLHHREPGPIAAAVEAPGVTIEVIADGVHLHPATVRLLMEAAGQQRICLVTDAVTPAGLGAGAFRIGREEAVLAGNEIRLPDGTIAGSAATMDGVVRNCVEWGVIDTAGALFSASSVPAKAAGVANRKGRIAPGYDADLVLLSGDLAVRETWKGGRCVYKSEEA